MKQQNNTKTALIYAVDLLATRPYSTQQLITKLKRKEVIAIFHDIENFKYVHELKNINLPMETFLGI